jgi:hypothetical protein
MIGQAELAGAVRDDDGALQEAMCTDAAEQRALRGDLHRVRMHVEFADTELIEVRRPGGLVGKDPLSMLIER